ncbi:MAG: DUF2892 domain-containing protein [Rhodobiaceae bacterium]|nr:DUF2892 domain-containing protein [Planctomycetota bacterium]MCC0015085.1 DUF2892 domain-containing protein [Rhodobiaceae bacterium]
MQPKSEENRESADDQQSVPTIRLGSRRIPVPGTRILRIGLGVALIAAGFLGFLPVLGFWMLPAGIVVLSIDFALMRRWRRRSEVAIANNVLGRGRRRQPENRHPG